MLSSKTRRLHSPTGRRRDRGFPCPYEGGRGDLDRRPSAYRAARQRDCIALPGGGRTGGLSLSLRGKEERLGSKAIRLPGSETGRLHSPTGRRQDRGAFPCPYEGRKSVLDRRPSAYRAARQGDCIALPGGGRIGGLSLSLRGKKERLGSKAIRLPGSETERLYSPTGKRRNRELFLFRKEKQPGKKTVHMLVGKRERNCLAAKRCFLS